jgi:pSer/pThr/pTyr-binding forkhead associated (FHA) protein
MPFIVIKSNGQEIDRRVLSGAVVVGRAPDCDVTVRDILLSRRHCKFEESGDVWLLTDLQSKNGTIVNGERIAAPLVLLDNDVVRIGRAKIIFSLAQYDLEADLGSHPLGPERPADPSDSLSGTLSGFTLLMPGETETTENMPCPQPRPRDPAAFDNAELQNLLSAIASSSWDSIYSEARQPARERPNTTGAEDARPRPKRPRSPIDLSLQAGPGENQEELQATSVEVEIEAPVAEAAPLSAAPEQTRSASRKKWRQRIFAFGAAACIACVFLLSRDWTERGGSAVSSPRVVSAHAIAESPAPRVFDVQERLAAERVSPSVVDESDFELAVDPFEALGASSPSPGRAAPPAPDSKVVSTGEARSPAVPADLKLDLDSKQGQEVLKSAAVHCLRTLLW